jgi:gamma-glutamyltranspeptidase/glutathione hydrolase
VTESRLQEAIERPRFIQGRMRPTDPDDRLRIEARVGPRVLATLRRRGHPLDVVADWAVTMGHAHALTVRRDVGRRLLAGGADPRGDGVALAY